MDDRTVRDLRVELATLRDEVALLRSTVHEREPTVGRHAARRGRALRRIMPLALAILLVALIPLATLAATPFTDLTGGPHDGNIDAIYAAGITKGCDTTHYCPTENVTREEMASFLARTAGLGTNPPIVNAKTAQSAQTAVTAQSATNATNATQLGGQPAAAYLLSAAIKIYEGDISGGGPLPRDSQTFVATGTRAIIFMNASAYRATPGEMAIATSVLDPNGLGFGVISFAYTNEANSHKTLRSVMKSMKLVPGTAYTIRHTIRTSGTIFNADDYIHYMVIELP